MRLRPIVIGVAEEVTMKTKREFAIAAAIVFGYYGWKIGKRLYREYELSPRQQRRLAVRF